MKKDLVSPDLTIQQFKDLIADSDDLDLIRTNYTLQLGNTFVQMCGMEDSIINAMKICDLILVGNVLGSDTEAWERMLAKDQILKDSTLGNLLKILSKHNISDEDLKYLKWVKAQRDFLVHRLFHQGGWPGELDKFNAFLMIRQMRYLQLIFWRAERSIWKIFARANLMILDDLGAAGFIIMNHGPYADAVIGREVK